LWATVLTAQRTGALGGTRIDRVSEMPDRPGWVVWNWRGAEMKERLPHGLPIPPAAQEILARFDDPDAEGGWMFPSRQSGRHVTSEGIQGLLYRLQGCSKPGRVPKKGGPRRAQTARIDYFARYDIRPWVPHDVRRALGTFLDEEELGGAGSAILAHTTGKKDDELARLEDTTRKNYAKAQRLTLKARGMEVWVAAVISAYEREKAALDRATEAEARRTGPSALATSRGRSARTNPAGPR
jgi:integrase